MKAMIRLLDRNRAGPCPPCSRLSYWRMSARASVSCRFSARSTSFCAGARYSSSSVRQVAANRLSAAINRLEPIDSGAVFFDGKPIPVEGRELARHRSDVGMVFQSFNLFAHKTILQNVTLGPVNVRGIAKAEAAAQAIGLLERVGIEDQADKYPAQLSGGKQQRAAIARPRSWMS
jgi:ABC-type ATPase involved in cell division